MKRLGAALFSRGRYSSHLVACQGMLEQSTNPLNNVLSVV